MTQTTVPVGSTSAQSTWKVSGPGLLIFGSTSAQVIRGFPDTVEIPRPTLTITPAFAPNLSGSATIIVDQNIRGGVPCVGEGRWPIAHILDGLALGLTIDQIRQDRPGLTVGDIQAALEVAAYVMRDPEIDWQQLSLSSMLQLQSELKEWQTLSSKVILSGDDETRR